MLVLGKRNQAHGMIDYFCCHTLWSFIEILIFGYFITTTNPPWLPHNNKLMYGNSGLYRCRFSVKRIELVEWSASFVVTLLDPWAPILLSTVIEQPRSKLGPCNYRVSHISKVLASPSHIAQWSQVSACELPHFHGWTTGCNSCNLSLYQER